MRRRRSHHAAARQTSRTRPRRRSGRRAPGGRAAGPTSGSTRQQRAHFDASGDRIRATVPPAGRARRYARHNRDLGPFFVRSAGSLLRASTTARQLPASEEPICPRAAPPPERPVMRAPDRADLGPLAPRAGSSRQRPGSSGKSCRCTLSCSPNRAPHASSAVKHSTGASQMVRHRCK